MGHPHRLAVVAALIMVTTPACVVAAEGGGGGPECFWAIDHVVDLGSKKILLPHALFRASEVEHEVDGYHVSIDKTYYFITFVSPDGMTYRAGLSRMEDKRCVAYFIGKPEFVKRVE